MTFLHYAPHLLHSAVLPSAGLACLPRTRRGQKHARRTVLLRAQAANGAGERPVEMYIASDVLNSEPTDAMGDIRTLAVAPPRRRGQQEQNGTLSSAGLSERSLQVEVSIANSNYRAATQELRKKDAEIELLKQALAQRDQRLAASQEEMLAASTRMQRKEEDLRDAYEKLTVACKERAEVRAELIDVQMELTETRLDHEAWTEELLALTDLVGGGADYAISDGLSASRSSSSSSQSGEKGGKSSDAATLEMLQQLSQLSRDIAKDAAQDEETFSLERAMRGDT